MIVALRGWIDAGSAAQVAIVALKEEWPLRRIALFDSDAFLDYQHRRPGVRLDARRRRRIEWQEIEVLAGSAGPRDVVVLTGPEPARHWPSFVDAALDMGRRLGVVEVYALGGLPAPAPHTRPVQIVGSVSEPGLTERFDALLGSYEGPTGAQTVLQVAWGEAGIRAMTLWAQVPHYLSAMAWPGAAVALLEKLGSMTGTQLRLESLRAAERERRRQIDRAISERPEIRALVQAMEEGEPVEEIPSGDELAAEIERFLAQPPGEEPSSGFPSG
jgi:proteasome assembly chaperone (PAC2) family protein